MSSHAFGAGRLADARNGRIVSRQVYPGSREHQTSPGTLCWRRGPAASNGQPVRRQRHRCTCEAKQDGLQPDLRQVDGEILLDVVLPAPPALLCRAIFGDASLDAGADGGGTGSSSAAQQAGLYAQFLEQDRGCLELSAQSWGPGSPTGNRCRLLRYSTQLSARQRLLLPFGPAAVPNREEQLLEVQSSNARDLRKYEKISSDSGSSNGPSSSGRISRRTALNYSSQHAIFVSCTCTSSGVPFADAFANQLRWQLLPVADAAAAGGGGAGTWLQPLGGDGGGGVLRGSTRLLVAASCRFTKPVLGPLRGQIESESMQGMRELYVAFQQYLQLHCSFQPAAGMTNVARSTLLSVPPAEQAVQLPTGLATMPAEADSNSSNSWAAAQSLAQRLVPPAAAPGDALRQVAAAWPVWASAGCRLPAGRPSPAALASCPSPEQAAAVLQAVARRALRLPLAQRQQELARHRVVRGLLAALRLPSPPAVQPCPALEAAAPVSAAAADAPASAPSVAGIAPSPAAAAAGGSASDAAGATSAAAAGVPAPGMDGALLCSLGSPAAVSATLWSLAVLGGSLYWQEEAEALCALLPACRFTKLYQISDVAWALGTMRHHTAHLPWLEQQAAALLQQQLAAAAAGEAGEGAGAGGRPCLPRMSSALWGLATLGHRPVRLLDLLPAALQAQRAQQAGGTGAAREAAAQLPALASAGWSVAAAGCLRHPAVADLAAELAAVAAALQPPAAAKKATLLQLHQFALALQQDAEAATSAMRLQEREEPQHDTRETEQHPAVAAWTLLQRQPAALELLAAAASAWAAEAERRGSKQVSACQADVAATARTGLGLAVQEESVAAGLSVDIAVPAQRLAIEVDGPSHFCRNSSGHGISAVQPAPQLPTGSTLLKRRLLHRAGWRVASVGSADWERLRSAAQKRAYLGAAIAAASSMQDLADLQTPNAQMP